jgi:hypothetical protein
MGTNHAHGAAPHATRRAYSKKSPRPNDAVGGLKPRRWCGGMTRVVQACGRSALCQCAGCRCGVPRGGAATPVSEAACDAPLVSHCVLDARCSPARGGSPVLGRRMPPSAACRVPGRYGPPHALAPTGSVRACGGQEGAMACSAEGGSRLYGYSVDNAPGRRALPLEAIKSPVKILYGSVRESALQAVLYGCSRITP